MGVWGVGMCSVMSGILTKFGPNSLGLLTHSQHVVKSIAILYYYDSKLQLLELIKINKIEQVEILTIF